MDLKFYQGEQQTVAVDITGDDGSAFDLTGFDLSFRWRVDETDQTKEVGSGISVVDAGEGSLEIAFDPDDTDIAPGRYPCELRISDDDQVITVFEGSIVIRESLYAS